MLDVWSSGWARVLKIRLGVFDSHRILLKLFILLAELVYSSILGP